MLYYLGIMQVVIKYIAMVMQFLMGTTAGESLNAAGNIFVGQVFVPVFLSWLIYLSQATITLSNCSCHYLVHSNDRWQQLSTKYFRATLNNFCSKSKTTTKNLLLFTV